MEGALEEMITAIDHSQSDSPGGASDDQIVVVRPEVVETIGHVLGNLFQRIYHLIDQIGRTESAAGAHLQQSTRQLENFLQLVIDYFSPPSLTLQYVTGADIAQSLASQVSDRSGCVVKIGANIPAESQLLVDPARLVRAFALLADQLVPTGEAERPVLRVLVHASGSALHFVASIPSVLVVAPSSIADTQWTVAEKLVVIQGGTLQRRTAGSGEVTWEIALPLQT